MNTIKSFAIFLAFVLFLLLLTFLLRFAFLSLTAEILIFITLTFIIVIIALFGIEIFVIWLVIIIYKSFDCSDLFGSWGWFIVHVNFDISFLEILQQGLKLNSFNTHELNTFLIFFQNNFYIKLFVGNRSSRKLNIPDFVRFEIHNWLHDKDQRLLQHVKPSRLRLYITLHTWLSISRFEIVARVNDINLRTCLNQINKHLKQVSIVVLLQLF